MTNSKQKPQSKLMIVLSIALVAVVIFFVVMWYQSSHVVEVVFKFLNFGIFCALAFYVFKTKEIPKAKEKIAQKQAELQSKVNQTKTLLGQQKDLDRSMQEQELLAQKLFDQVKIWSSSFEHQQKKLREEQDELTQKAKQRAQQQAELTLGRAVKQQVFTKALHNAQEKLTAQFVSEAAGKKFIASIVEHMRKEVQ